MTRFSILRNIAVLALAGVGLSGCGMGLGREAALTPGVATQADVERVLSAPIDTQPSAGRTDAQMLSYRGARCRYQFKKGDLRLDARLCDVDASRGEGTLQYWRHQWKNQKTRIVRLTKKQSEHMTPWALFKNLDTRQSVLFNAASGKVIAWVEKAGGASQ